MMHQTRPQMGRASVSFLSDGWVQLALCLAIGVIFPFYMFYITEFLPIYGMEHSRNSLLIGLGCTGAAIFMLRQMAAFPGTSDGAYFLPAFMICYAVGVTAILIFRLPYSGTIITASFLTSIIIRFVIGALIRQGPNQVYHVVPGGRVDQFLQIPGIETTLIKTPSIPPLDGAIIVVDLHHNHSDEWEHTLAQAVLKGVAVYHYKQVREAISGRVQIEHLSENSLGSLLPSLSYRKVKRLVDILASLILLPILIIPMAIVAIIIKWDSKGPVLFYQERVGYRGEPFKVTKFRTMTVTAQDQSGDVDMRNAAMTKENDARITRIGQFLRRSRIDELPQIVNVLRGQMSWIGPRPEAKHLSEWYESELPFYSYRHIVRPGITGWAQVNQGHVSNLSDVDTKLQYDFFYIKNFSYWIDIIIFLRTFLVILNGFGAK